MDLGGHPMAAGFTVHKKNLHKLKNRLMSIADRLIRTSDLVPQTIIDMELDPFFIENKLFDELDSFAPFGQANPKPTFAAFNLAVRQARLIGRERNHLKLILSSKNNPKRQISAIGFNFGKLFASLGFDSLLDVVYEIERDEWNGQSDLILKLKDVRLAS